MRVEKNNWIESTKWQEQLKAKNDILQSVNDLSLKIPDKAKVLKDVAPKILKALKDEGFDMKKIRDKTRTLSGANSKFWKLILLE